MKYLKLFNESIDKENLTDLCDMCLAYLMDDGYEYEIQEWNWLDYKVIKFELISRGCNFVEVGGDWNERYKESLRLINEL